MSSYTPEMVAKLRAAAPLTADKAEKLAAEFGVSYRSVVSKAVNEGIEYIKKAPARKRGGVKKADMVAQFERNVGRSTEGMGFDKLNTSGLAFLLQLTSDETAS